MPTVVASTVVEAPPERVWQAMEDPHRYPELVVPTERMLETSDVPIRQGTVYREYGGVRPFVGESTWTVTEYRPHDFQRHLGKEPTLSYDLAISLEDLGEGRTRFTQRLTITPAWYLVPDEPVPVADDDARAHPGRHGRHRAQRQARRRARLTGSRFRPARPWPLRSRAAPRRGSQVVRQRTANPLFTGSIPVPASRLTAPDLQRCGQGLRRGEGRTRSRLRGPGRTPGCCRTRGCSPRRSSRPGSAPRARRCRRCP